MELNKGDLYQTDKGVFCTFVGYLGSDIDTMFDGYNQETYPTQAIFRDLEDRLFQVAIQGVEYKITKMDSYEELDVNEYTVQCSATIIKTYSINEVSFDRAAIHAKQLFQQSLSNSSIRNEQYKTTLNGVIKYPLQPKQ